MNTDEALAYAIGLFDAEGSIITQPRGKGYTLRLGMQMIEERPIALMAQVVGGSVGYRNDTRDWTWSMGATSAVRFLGLVGEKGYMKAAQARMACYMIGNGVPEGERAPYVAYIRAHNGARRRFPHPPPSSDIRSLGEILSIGIDPEKSWSDDPLAIHFMMGLFDGEGCITSNLDAAGYAKVTVHFGANIREVNKLFENRWGGKTYNFTDGVWPWRVNGGDAIPALEEIARYSLTTKAKQAIPALELARELMTGRGSAPRKGINTKKGERFLSPEDMDRRRGLVGQITYWGSRNRHQRALEALAVEE